jgi:hypothetical protein
MPNFQVDSLLVLKRRVPGTIVHPKATIFAIAGPIIIGMGCIIEEGAIIVNRYVLIKLYNLIAYAILVFLAPGEKRLCELATRIFSKLVVVRVSILKKTRIIIMMLWINFRRRITYCWEF